MRAWRIAVTRLLCGGEPDCTIQTGDPYLELSSVAGAWKKIRCAAHAGEPVPAVIAEPAAIVTTARSLPSGFTGIRDLTNVLKFQQQDYKLRQSGE